MFELTFDKTRKITTLVSILVIASVITFVTKDIVFIMSASVLVVFVVLTFVVKGDYKLTFDGQTITVHKLFSRTYTIPVLAIGSIWIRPIGKVGHAKFIIKSQDSNVLYSMSTLTFKKEKIYSFFDALLERNSTIVLSEQVQNFRTGNGYGQSNFKDS